MIAVQLKGGMSNQMFEYATARRLAHTLGVELRLDIAWFDNIAPGDTPRHYELDCFEIAGQLIRRKQLAIVGEAVGKKERLKSVFRTSKRPELKLFQEKGFRFDKSVLSLQDNNYLEGYFQSEKYFVDIRNLILKDFTYKNEPSAENHKLLNRIRSTNSVSVHVRRGDYVSNPHAQKFHGLMPVEYYDKATKLILKQVKDPVFYVISDDPEWCKQHLRLPSETIYVDSNDDPSQGSEDMRLMRACQHNIIANSSFSWWGAWLNENPSKMVIAPKKWFNHSESDTSDLIPNSWQKI